MKWKFIYRMALRNITRNWRRTALSAFAIAMAVMLVCFMQSYVKGIFSNMKDNVFMFETGHVKIQNKYFLEEEKLMPLDLSVYGYNEDYTEVLDLVRSVDGVETAVARTRFIAMLNRDGKLRSIRGIALDPEAERPVNPLADSVIEGRLFRDLAPGVYEMVMGNVLAQELGVKVGDKLTLMTKTAEEGLALMTFTVTGLVSYDIVEYDKAYFYIPLSTATVFLKMPVEVGEILLFTSNPSIKNVTALAERVQAKLDEAGDEPYVAGHWGVQYNGQYYQLFVQFQYIYIFMQAMFLFLASLVIINTTMMVIYERMREIGTIAALGMRGQSIVRLFFLEAVIIAGLGSLAGTFAGGILSFIASRLGINFAKMAGEGISFQISHMIYPHFGIGLLVFSFLFGILVAAGCSYLPARKAARIDPVEAMRGVQ